MTVSDEDDAAGQRFDRMADLRRGLQWVRAVVRQVERLHADFIPWRAALVPEDGDRLGRMREAQELGGDFWTDAHQLYIATSNLEQAVSGVEGLPRSFRRPITILRNCLEHWEDGRDNRGAWKGLREEHGEFATPTSVMFSDAQGSHLVLSDYEIDIDALADAARDLGDRLKAELDAI